FRIERTFNKLSAEERFVARKETLQPVMTEFFHWCESFAYLPKSQLGKAVQYAVNHKDGLQIVLLDGRLELSNNRAERAIKELVIGRKNWLFSKSLKGARSNGIILSIIQTAVANGLNIRKYLNHLFTEIPNLSSMTPEALRAYLPWNQQIQEICK
ncbi:transposase, partial [Enterococcus faecium]|nr:transposase [Enterococcus faecium]